MISKGFLLKIVFIWMTIPLITFHLLMMHCNVLVNWATHTSFHIILILIKTVYSMWKFCSFAPISLSSLVITKLSGSMGKNRFADVSRITLHLIYTLLVYPLCFLNSSFVICPFLNPFLTRSKDSG